MVWPLAMPLLYAILLYCCRGPIQHHQPSPLSRAIRFLWSDYEDGYYWYEMVLLTKKLVRKHVIKESKPERLIRIGGLSQRWQRIAFTQADELMNQGVHLYPFREAANCG